MHTLLSGQCLQSFELLRYDCIFRTMLTPSFRFHVDPTIPDQTDPLIIYG